MRLQNFSANFSNKNLDELLKFWAKDAAASNRPIILAIAMEYRRKAAFTMHAATREAVAFSAWRRDVATCWLRSNGKEGSIRCSVRSEIVRMPHGRAWIEEFFRILSLKV